jgi:hypothetical protein
LSSFYAGADSPADFTGPLALFLDANALFSDWQRALWCSFASLHGDAPLYHSGLVLDECFRNLLRLGHLTESGANLSRQQWEMHPQTQCVDAFDAYLADVRAVHEKDRHVAAAALKLRHAQPHRQVLLLTWNIRDFPRPALRRLGIQRFSPDEFVRALLMTQPGLARSVLQDSLAQAGLHRRLLTDCLSAYQQRASGFPADDDAWPDFLNRTGFRQAAKRWVVAPSG